MGPGSRPGRRGGIFARQQSIFRCNFIQPMPSLRAQAKQSISRQKRKLDCFVASAPRNDDEIRLRIPAARCTRGLPTMFRPFRRGRGECRVPGAPAASCAHGVVSMHTSIHSEVANNIRHPHAMVLRLMARSPRRPGFLASVAPEKRLLLTNLMPASGHQDHTSSPSASAPFVIGASASTASRRPRP
jgi:hypothetical protein